MKNPGKLFALIALFLLINNTETKAQISFSAGLRFAPAWAPVEYAHHTRYYYLPDLDGYYDASLGGYYFHDQDGDDWFFTRTLPENFQGFDFYSSPRIALEYFGDRPFEFFRERRLGYFNEYHPDGRIPYYSGYYRGIDRNRDGYRNYEAGRNFHQDRDFYAHENYGDRRDVTNFADKHGVNNRTAAYMLALDRVANAIRLRGLYA